MSTINLICQYGAQMNDAKSSTRWLDETEDLAWRGLRRVDLFVMPAISRDLQSDSKLSESDYDVLSSLSERRSPRCRFKDLAVLTRWSTSRLSHHLDRMEGRGLVVREGCEDDGRGANIALTQAGLDALGTAAPLHVASVRRHLFDLLSPEQTEALADITQTLAAHHEPESPEND